MKDSLETLRIFIAAATASSFREAAARLEIAPQGVTRAIQSLEQRLGEVLFHRSTRAVQLTDFGQHFLEQARRAVNDVEALFETATMQTRGDVAGLVRVAAPSLHGRQFVMPVLARLGQQHPGLHFDLRLNDARIDAVAERIDVGLRGGAVQDNRFVARRVASIPLHICAAPALLARLPKLRSVRDLDNVPTTQLIDQDTGRPWPWALSQGREFVPAQTAFASDDPLAECEAVLAGLGVGQLPEILVGGHLRSGRLQALFPDQQSRPWPLTVYRVRRLPVPLRIRVTYDALIAAFR